MAVLDPNEIMFRAFEPKVQNRFVLYVDGIPSFLVKNVSAPEFTEQWQPFHPLHQHHWKHNQDNARA